jgi:hypothetical protein
MELGMEIFVGSLLEGARQASGMVAVIDRLVGRTEAP